MKIVALVLAGGEGSRLYPLTAEHAKPALAFANGYRIVDFVLSNLVNSKISTIYVGGQFKGTADAVYQYLELLQSHQPDLVAVFAADHIYRMDVRQMAAFHAERR